MEGKKSFFIILIIVAFLAIAVLGLTGFILVTQSAGGAQHAQAKPISEEDKRPKDEELEKMELFEKEEFFNLKPTQTEKTPIIALIIELKYFKKVDGVKDVHKKVVGYEADMSEIISSYFQKMTKEEAISEQTKMKSKEELKEKINKLLSGSEKEYKDFIYEVTFKKWFCQ